LNRDRGESTLLIRKYAIEEEGFTERNDTQIHIALILSSLFLRIESGSGDINKQIHCQEVPLMKPMIWHPEPKDEKVNRYLDKINHEPWLAILATAFLLLCFFTLLVFLGVF
jgi:hypothetical protein